MPLVCLRLRYLNKGYRCLGRATLRAVTIDCNETASQTIRRPLMFIDAVAALRYDMHLLAYGIPFQPASRRHL